MTKPDTSKLQGPLKEAIDAELGGYDAFVEASLLRQLHALVLAGLGL